MLIIRGVFKNLRMLAILAFVLPIALSALVSTHSFAQASTNNNANTLKVSPVRSDVQIAKGQSKGVPITVTNLTSSPITITPIENDFTAGDENGTPAIILDANTYAPTHSLKRFMTPLGNVTIPAKGSKTIEVVITVPATAQAGGYFGAVRFAPASPDGSGQVNLSGSVASLILLTVPGPTVEQLNLTNFDIQQDGKSGTDFRTPNGLKAAFRFENKGNIQLAPFGKISVKKGDKVVYETDFNIDAPRGTILPDSARRWEVPLQKIDSFGHYTVLATLTYGSKNQTIDVSKSFWVIPLWMIIAAIGVVVLIIAIIVFLIFFFRGRQHRRARRRAGSGRLRR